MRVTRNAPRPTPQRRACCAFKGLALSFVTVAGQTYRHVSPLAEVQHKILDLLDHPVTIYTELAVNSANPP